ncbi:hypothetical protein CIL03_16435 [Virgibacillus indicus]|uniref:Uncharacterized protein n=1 Tax=Virgibacillus indicus TaxID=2024554 RepID=A0A265N6D4_9BACI|nr:hypothetical protein [Virgibacillus indicus]OZU87407.1 hypothetical protein CIL03_16435 [Virgibacillus indicus]
MKERFLWTGIVLVILSGIGNYIYFQSKQLDEPIFMEHYYKQDIMEQQMETQLTFYYLTNKQNPSTVQYANINGIEVYPSPFRNASFWEAGKPQIYFEKEFTHHYIVPVTFDIPVDQIPLDEKTGEWSFGKMEIVFSDNQKLNADIGEVEIVKEEQTPSGLAHITGISNNLGESSDTLEAENTLTVEEFSIPFAAQIEDEMAIKLTSGKAVLEGLEDTAAQFKSSEKRFNKKFDSKWDEFPGVYLQNELFPFQLEQDEYLEISMKFVQNRSRYLDFPITIKGTSGNGESFHSRVHVKNWPSVSQEKINEIIAEKKAGDSK